jgi:hypothetical protein
MSSHLNYGAASARHADFLRQADRAWITSEPGCDGIFRRALARLHAHAAAKASPRSTYTVAPTER